MASSDVSSVVNHFPTVNEGFITTVAGSSVSSGGTAVSLASVSGLTNGTAFVGIIEPGEANEQVFTGTVDTGGSQIVDVVWTRGANVVHPIGATVVDYVTGTAINMITKGILVSHNQDGTFKAISAPSMTLTGNAAVGGTLAVTGNTTLNGVTLTSRTVPSLQTMTSGATLTPNSTTYSIAECAALGINTTLANPTGTPVNGQVLVIRLKDDGTARTIAYGTDYANISGLDSLTTTVANKWSVICCMYSTVASKWQIVSISTEA
jgi:hypothetical protein